MKKFLHFNDQYIWVECNENFITGIRICNDINIIKQNQNIINKSYKFDHAKEALSQLKKYFNNELVKFDLPIYQEGTTFQNRVWKEISKIPYGQTVTYGDIARKIGGLNYARAIGGACNANNLPIVIPCHRIISKSGIGGFAFDIEFKAQILKLES